MNQLPTNATAAVATLTQTPAIVARMQSAGAQASLHQLVALLLQEIVAADLTFTAYDVTQTLRIIFPASVRAIPHYPDGQGEPGVRALVHGEMDAYLQAGVYRRVTIRPVPGRPETAIGYEPTAGGARGGVTISLATQQLPRRVRIPVHLLPPQPPTTGSP